MVTAAFLNACDAKNCEIAHSGVFTYGDDISSNTIITRDGKTQIESNEVEGFEDVYSIVWLDACTYVLKPLSTNKPSKDYVFTEKDSMKVQITSVSDNEITFFAQTRFDVYNGKMKKINQ